MRVPTGRPGLMPYVSTPGSGESILESSRVVGASLGDSILEFPQVWVMPYLSIPRTRKGPEQEREKEKRARAREEREKERNGTTDQNPKGADEVKFR